MSGVHKMVKHTLKTTQQIFNVFHHFVDARHFSDQPYCKYRVRISICFTSLDQVKVKVLTITQFCNILLYILRFQNYGTKHEMFQQIDQADSPTLNRALGPNLVKRFPVNSRLNKSTGQPKSYQKNICQYLQFFFRKT